jgi:P-type conjugative transfer protein TrbG
MLKHIELVEAAYMEQKTRNFLVGLLVCASGCAAKLPPPRYFRAEPVHEPARTPAVVAVPQPMYLPQLQAKPSLKRSAPKLPPEPCVTDPNALEGLDGEKERKLTAAEKKKLRRNEANCAETMALLAETHREASQNPSPDDFYNKNYEPVFEDGAVYAIYTAPFRVTTLALQPGEQITVNEGKPVMGDKRRWRVTVGKTIRGKAEQQLIFIKPNRPGLDTSMTIVTNRRTYLLELHAFPSEYFSHVEWSYPEDEIQEMEQVAESIEAKEKVVTASLNLAAANFRYEVQVLGGKPRWKPEQVFDDGQKTFIKFPKSMLVQVAPVFFVLGKGDEALVVNYRVNNEYYVVDRLFDVGELRLGQDNQDIVRISRK